MNESKLKIGIIQYANLFPVFYTLQKECDCSSYEFVEDVPSRLNLMLRKGAVDISPSSSIEYLKNPDLYRIIEGHSISSRGPVGSILLFSDKPFEALNGAVIDVSSQSETSVALLDIILKKFYMVDAVLRVSDSPESSGANIFLLIGDDALKYSVKDTQKNYIVYDLGEIWHRKTGLPFVFALWIARKEFFEQPIKKQLLKRFTEDLNKTKKSSLSKLDELAKHSPLKSFMKEDEIVAYWRKIDYGLSDENKKGLELFNRYLKELEYF